MKGDLMLVGSSLQEDVTADEMRMGLRDDVMKEVV